MGMAGAQRSYFNTKDTKLAKGASQGDAPASPKRRSHGLAARAKRAFAFFVPFVLK
jgi:hypothetical protein